MAKDIIICSQVATVLTVYGIETGEIVLDEAMFNTIVATVLTVYGIETACILFFFKVSDN